MSSFQVFLLATCFTLTSANIFTSSHKVFKIARNEDRILSSLKEYIDEVSEQYAQLRRERNHRYATEAVEDMDHPNGMYYVIKRFAWHYVNVLGDTLRYLSTRLIKDQDPIVMARAEDYEGALLALLRLQEIYNLETSDMAKGDYRGYLGPALGFEDAYLLGKVAFTNGAMNSSVEWLQKALEMRNEDPQALANPTIYPTKAAILALIGRSFVLLQKVKHGQAMLELAMMHDPTNGDVRALKEDVVKMPVLIPTPEKTTKANYSRLCQYREPYVVEKPDYKAMKCRYKPGLLPYYVFREEILSTSPYVSLFYNVVTEEERDFLKQSVYTKLRRGFVGSGINEGKSRHSDIRTSDVAWLGDNLDVRIARVSTRIGLVTGLNVQQSGAPGLPNSSEDIQVVNYGIGGHYDVHLDPFDKPDASGFRIATFLLYLNDVVEGGNTVFTSAGISVAPNKDTVLFWYSFPPAFETRDHMTHHAGCPVLLGQKWIANKWIRSFGNDLFRPCGLRPDTSQLDLESTMAEYHRRGQRLPSPVSVAGNGATLV